MEFLILNIEGFTPYAPTTILGLLGAISAYLFYYFRGKNNNKLQELKSINPKDRLRALEMMINELGVSVDTSSLSSIDKLNLITKLIQAKTRKFAIAAITLISLAIILATILWLNNMNDVHLGNNVHPSVDSSSILPLGFSIPPTPPRVFEFKTDQKIKLNSSMLIFNGARIVQGEGVSFDLKGGVKLDISRLDDCGDKHNKQSFIQFGIVLLDYRTKKEIAMKVINEFSNFGGNGGRDNPQGCDSFVSFTETLTFTNDELKGTPLISVYLKVVNATLKYKHMCGIKEATEGGFNEALNFQKGFSITKD